MRKQEPLKYRLISSKYTPSQEKGRAGWRNSVLCLNNGLHVDTSFNEFFEFNKLEKLPTNMADAVVFSRCDCDKYPETAPPWLAELTQAYLDNPRKAVSPKRKAAKPKKRPTMGR